MASDIRGQLWSSDLTVSQMHRFESIVNHVSLVSETSGNYVEKKYANIALGTGIPVPLLRFEIEYRVLKHLRSIADASAIHISVPKVHEINVIGSSLKIQYIKGETLAHKLRKGEQLKGDFFQLGRWLRLAETELYSHRDNIFDGLWQVQKKTAGVMAALKGEIQAPVALSHPEKSVSLGDVGLDNLIWSSTKLWVIDFEFAHLSIAARDIGQLLAQLDVKLNQSNIFGKNLIEGYVSTGGNSVLAEAWREIFSNYYKTKTELKRQYK